MLEILLVTRFVAHLAAIAQQKQRSKSWAALGAIGWIAGELIGGVLGFMIGAEGIAVYGVALLGAALGALLAYATVRMLADHGDAPSAMRHDESTVTNTSYDPKNPYSPPRVE